MTGPDRRMGEEPVYGPPVDPWADAEAAHLAASPPAAHPSAASTGPTAADAPARSDVPTGSGMQTHAGVPTGWGAQTAPRAPGASGAAGSAVAGAAAGGGRWRSAYRKPVVWVAAAVAVVVAVSATVVVLWARGYPALDYRTLADVRRVAAPVSSSFARTQVVGERTYLAASDEGRLVVVAVRTATGEEIWRSDAAGTAQRWERMIGLPGEDAVAILADVEAGAETRRMVILGGRSGEKLWERPIGRDDAVHFAGDTVVVTERPAAQVVGLDLRDGGQVRWRKPNPKNTYGGTTAAVLAAGTVADRSGPAGTDGAAFAVDPRDDRRFVRIGADRSAQVFDAASGNPVSDRANVADPDDALLAHDGKLFVGVAENGYQIFEYDLDSLGQPKIIYSASDTNRRLRQLTACGAGRLCLIDVAAGDAKTAEVVAVRVTEGGDLWRTAVPEADHLIQVGESLLVSRTSAPAGVTLLDGKGAKVWDRPGAAGRIDGGNLLHFSRPPTGYVEDVSLAGEHLGDDAVQLGPLTGVRAETCSWNDTVIACAADKDFVLRRFAD